MADAVAIKAPKGPSVSYAKPIAEQKALAKQRGQLEGALANLLQHEKTARLVRAPAPRAKSAPVPAVRSARAPRSRPSG